jgi:hypothetical protein
LHYTVGARWLSPRLEVRQHWRVRQAHGESSGQGGSGLGNHEGRVVDDTVDACSHPHTRDAWSPVWGRLHMNSLPRQHRVTAWQLLHCAIPCGAQRAHISCLRQGISSAQAADLAACPRPHCHGAPETLTHLFLDCPSSRRVWEWLSAVWVQLSSSTSPPITAAVLLAGDQRQWSPPPPLQPLWTQLRVATIETIRAAQKQRRSGIPTTATSIAATVVHHMRAALLRDWQRTRTAGSIASLSSGVCCSAWLRGRQPFLTVAQFQSHWGEPGVLYALSQQTAGQQRVHVLWSVQHPVPIPMGQGV